MTESTPSIQNEKGLLEAFFGILLKSPIAIVTAGISLVLGYLLSFMLFSYKLPRGANWLVHLGLGFCYTAFVFIITNINLIIANYDGLTYDMVERRLPLTLIAGPAIAFVAFCVVTLRRDSGGGRR